MNRAELIVKLAEHLRSSNDEIEQIIHSAPYRYKHYQIEKRDGGLRDIYHPTPELKAIQRWLVEHILSMLPVHDSVYSYVAGKNIGMHASVHTTSNYFLRLDFKDFFPSIDRAWISDFLSENISSGSLDVALEAVPSLARIFCRWSEADNNFALSIGAPSSPAISNAILFPLDASIKGLCEAFGCNYTRYADDLYISSREPNLLKDIELAISGMISSITPKLSLNEKKTLHASRRRKVMVTGLVISSDRKVSLGREMKRSIKTQVFLWISGRLDPSNVSHLRGLLAHAYGVDLSFYRALEFKFGADNISELMRG